jgi:hypothetical protein
VARLAAAQAALEEQEKAVKFNGGSPARNGKLKKGKSRLGRR